MARLLQTVSSLTGDTEAVFIRWIKSNYFNQIFNYFFKIYNLFLKKNVVLTSSCTYHSVTGRVPVGRLFFGTAHCGLASRALWKRSTD